MTHLFNSIQMSIYNSFQASTSDGLDRSTFQVFGFTRGEMTQRYFDSYSDGTITLEDDHVDISKHLFDMSPVCLDVSGWCEDDPSDLFSQSFIEAFRNDEVDDFSLEYLRKYHNSTFNQLCSKFAA